LSLISTTGQATIRRLVLWPSCL